MRDIIKTHGKGNKKMYDELKKMSMKKVLVKVILFLIVMVVLTVISLPGIRTLMGGPKTLKEIPLNQLESSYVNDDIFFLVDSFAEYYETEKNLETILKEYYIIPIGTKEYIGIEINSRDFKESDQIFKETYAYITGEQTKLPPSMSVKGTIVAMEDDILDYYEDWGQTSGYFEGLSEEEIKELLLPYVLKTDCIGNMDMYTFYIICVVIGILFIIVLTMIIKCIAGVYQSPIKKHIKKNQNTINQERMENDFLSSTWIDRCKLGREWLFYFKGNKSYVLNLNDILWAYRNQTTHRTNGIKTGTSHSLEIRTIDKKSHSIPMKYQKQVTEILDHFLESQPQIIVGYDEDILKLYRSNFQDLLEISKRRRDSTIAE